MNKEQFTQLWNESGLKEYYSRIDELDTMGFEFTRDKYGDIDYYQGEALREFLTKRNATLTTINLQEIKDNFKEILDRASTLKHNERQNNI